MSIFFHQPLSSQALDPLEIITLTKWEGLNFSLGRKEMDPLCTNKLTQEKCQRIMKFCCSGGKTQIIFSLFCIRSGEEWQVKHGEYIVYLKSSKEVNPFLPPTTGWWFNKGRGFFEEDLSLTCSPPSNSPPCCLTVTLSGAAKEVQEHWVGQHGKAGDWYIAKMCNFLK